MSVSTAISQIKDVLRALLPPVEPSSLDHLLETNDPPSDVELRASRKSLFSEKRRLQLLQQTIILIRILADLERQRDESKAKIRRHVSILSPLRQLPPEILRKIFWLSVPPIREMETIVTDGGKRFGIRDSPWVLAHVCSRWRAVALSFPSLWKTIIIAPGVFPLRDSDDDFPQHRSRRRRAYYSESAAVPYPLALFKAQLIRSMDTPLHIVIRSRDLEQELLDTLLTSCSRWETLESTSFFPSFFGHRFPMLRKIKLDSGSRAPPFRGTPLPEKILQVDAPALRDVVLGSYQDSVGGARIVPWRQITRYEALGGYKDYLSTLALAVNVVEFHLEMLSPGLATNPRVVAPTLRKLYLSGTEGFALNPGTLVVPNLEGIFFWHSPVYSLPWLQTARCQLNRVVLTNLKPVDAILELFQQFPTITDLTFNTHRYHDPSAPQERGENLVDFFFRHLKANDQASPSGCLLPGLERIAICFHQSKRHFGRFVDFVHSRRAMPAPTLQFISLAGASTSKLQIVKNQVDQEGLEVHADAGISQEEWLKSQGW
ncbi:hypothetical protein B0H16DRAFT_1537404 [Mycena metata]|uniref:F-box domain-containing protein n=1 Tax=Mycena metata TaxID=1033252 RepID=A0AAD7J873_9AGAR|nr:hypothetical protein B0H16DRAFT_1537404 [Mycena metata]